MALQNGHSFSCAFQPHFCTFNSFWVHLAFQKAQPKNRVAGGENIVAAGLKLMSEILSNVSKTRSEISMTFARNARA
jgi:hypothetical protein